MTLEETYESLLEGINDPGVFKAVFMAGGPGSGKSLAAKKLGFSTMGLRPVNSDSSFEMGLKKAGLSLKMPESEEEQRDAVRVHAKAITAKRQDMLVKGRMGLVIDSTARDVKKLITQKKLLEQLGYETAMVFVNTSLETALDRNRQRERSIPDKIVQDNHKVVRSNMGKLQNSFGRGNFFIVDNDGDTKDLDKNTTKIFPRLQSFVKSFPTNKMASAWKDALTMRPMKNIALAAHFEHPAEFDKRLFNEDERTDNLRDKQDREKEQLKVKHDREMDADRRRITRDKNRQTNPNNNTNEVSDVVMATKEKLYKDLKPQRKEFEKRYGKDKADDVMHATAMNMAKKHHKIAEGKYKTELTRQLQLEYANVGAYMRAMRKKGKDMRRKAKVLSRKRQRSVKAGRGRFNKASIETAARKKAKDALVKKMYGGKNWKDLNLAQRFTASQKLKKKSGVIKRMVKKLMPKIKKERATAFAAKKQKQNQKEKQ